MREMNLSLDSRLVLYAALLSAISAPQVVTAQEGAKHQYIYKTVGQRNLKVEQRVPLRTSTVKKASSTLKLELRSRVATPAGNGRFEKVRRSVRWDPKSTAIIVCDMWDDHTCKAAASRVAELAPAVDRTVKAARQQGVLIIHAPSGTMSMYAETAQRRRAMEAPFHKAPVEIKWNRWDPKREGEPLAAIVDGGCSCEEPCPNFEVDEQGIRHWKQGGQIPWTRQIETIEIASEDAVSDSGQEIYNLMETREIQNVIVMGVHTNICVSGRPFGLRQMVYFGKNVVLCRDLTDALFQPSTGKMDHFRGTDLVVEHIEKHICPSIESMSITGKPAFRFEGDRDRK